MRYFVRFDDDSELQIDAGPEGPSLADDTRPPPAPVSLERVDGDVHLLRVGDRVHRVVAHPGEGRGDWALLIDGEPVRVEALDARSRQLREMTQALGGSSGPRPVVAPMPGLVVRIDVEVGQIVEEGQGVAIVEAMKMENELRAESAGRVAAIEVEPGQAVDKGQVLVELASLEDGEEAESTGKGA
jgi:pyruvate carboxylase subunit B